MSLRPPLIAAAAVGATAGLFYATGTLNHFYRFGSESDAFWFAGLIWHMDLRMTNPPAIGNHSFYSTHVSPLLYIPGLLSRLPGTEAIPFFAIVIGALHALATAIAGATIGIAARRLGASASIAAVVAALGAVGFGAMPLQVNFMRLPHYEILLPALLIALFTAVALDRTRPAAMIFAILLLVREDAGLHVAVFALAWAAAIWIRERRLDRRLCAFAVVGIAHAAVGFVIGPLVTGHSQGVVYNLYLGRPLFHHMTIDQIAARLDYFAYQCAHVWAPLIAIAAMAAWRRDLVLLVGPVAVVPWLVLNVGFGAHEAPATLSFYYAFPVLVAAVWPSIAAIAATGAGRIAAPWRPLGLQATVFALGFLPMFGPHLPFHTSRWANQDLVDREAWRAPPHYAAFAHAVTRHGRDLGTYVATVGVVGIAPLQFRRSQWAENIALDDAARIASLDSLLLFDSRLRCARAVALANRASFQRAYEIRGTRIVLLTRRRPEELAAWADLLVAREPGAPFCRDRPPTPAA